MLVGVKNNSTKNMIGRVKPARVPPHLARTSAFAACRERSAPRLAKPRLYKMSSYSIIEVAGRELCTRHRDLLYGVFRLKPLTESSLPSEPLRDQIVFSGTWRTLLEQMGLSHHRNNVHTLAKTLDDLKQAPLRVMKGSARDIALEEAAGRPFFEPLVSDARYSGDDVDDRFSIVFADWVHDFFLSGSLVSLDVEVYFKLASDYAKAIWPFIDSQPNQTSIDERLLAQLVQRNLTEMTAQQVAQMRRSLDRAFEDMKNAGGLASFGVSVMSGGGRKRQRRYTYQRLIPLRQQAHVNAPAAAPCRPARRVAEAVEIAKIAGRHLTPAEQEDFTAAIEKLLQSYTAESVRGSVRLALQSDKEIRSLPAYVAGILRNGTMDQKCGLERAELINPEAEPSMFHDPRLHLQPTPRQKRFSFQK